MTSARFRDFSTPHPHPVCLHFTQPIGSFCPPSFEINQPPSSLLCANVIHECPLTAHSMSSFHDGPTNNACVNGGLLLPKGSGRHGASPPNGKSPAATAPSTALTVIAREDDYVNSMELTSSTHYANEMQTVQVCLDWLEQQIVSTYK